jgi:hypothetical protein
VKKKDGPDAIPAIYFGTFIVVNLCLDGAALRCFCAEFLCFILQRYASMKLMTIVLVPPTHAHTILISADVALQSLLLLCAVLYLESRPYRRTEVPQGAFSQKVVRTLLKLTSTFTPDRLLDPAPRGMFASFIRMAASL